MSDTLKVFLTLTHYSIEKPTSPWFIQNGGNTGIGNMLFQISSSLCFAIKHNATLFVPGLETFFNVENIKKETSIFRNVCSECPPEYLIVIDDKMNSTSCQQNIWEYQFKNNMNFHEYFENYRNIMDSREMIQYMFGPLKEDVDYIVNKYPMILQDNICSIHVRLGPDYKEIYQDNHNRLYELQDSYWDCLDHMIQEKGIKYFFVFTNDREYCQSIFDKHTKYIDQGIRFYYSNERDFIDVWMISLIKNNIVSVSTLAWWGSFLNKHPDQYVVCYNGNRDDLHYPGWTVLPKKIDI
jgi:hypothetical protein